MRNMCFELKTEDVYRYYTVRNYVADRQFVNILVRRADWVTVETTHPDLNRQVVGSIEEAIAAVAELGWEVA